jgi:GTPase SAR1 family protein
MGIIGSIWTIIFTIIHVTVVSAFMCLIYVLFTALWLLDRLVLALNAISARCPDCKARCIIPAFTCPNCGTEHKKLVPGPYGVFSHRCSCGARLPSTFLNGRSKLEAHCPDCGHDLAASNARNFGIQLVGGVSSGKTTFLAAFLHIYLEKMNKKRSVRIKLHPDPEFKEMERWFTQGFSESTSVMNAAMYSIVHTLPGSKFSHQLSVYDIAGEVFSSQSASRVQGQYRYCEGIIIVVDPFSSRSVRAAYEGEYAGQRPSNYSTQDIQEVITGFIDEFSKIGVLSVGKISDVPVSVIISKSDVNVVKREIGYVKINSAYRTDSRYQSKDDARDTICRNYLNTIGMAGMINNLTAQFSKIHYFPVSAMGHEIDTSEAYDPWGIMEPVMWVIKEKNQELLEIIENY